MEEDKFTVPQRWTIEMMQWPHSSGRNSTHQWETKTMIHTKNLYSNVHGVTAENNKRPSADEWTKRGIFIQRDMIQMKY